MCTLPHVRGAISTHPPRRRHVPGRHVRQPVPRPVPRAGAGRRGGRRRVVPKARPVAVAAPQHGRGHVRDARALLPAVRRQHATLQLLRRQRRRHPHQVLHARGHPEEARWHRPARGPAALRRQLGHRPGDGRGAEPNVHHARLARPLRVPPGAYAAQERVVASPGTSRPRVERA